MNTTMTARYTAIAKALGSMKRCAVNGHSQEWEDRHANALKVLCDGLPHGSGFDSESELDLDESTSDKLVFTTSFHHMNEDGFYCGWTEHTVILTPAFELGYHLKVTGRDVNQIKEYIAELFGSYLSEQIETWAGYEQPKSELISA